MAQSENQIVFWPTRRLVGWMDAYACMHGGIGRESSVSIRPEKMAAKLRMGLLSQLHFFTIIC